MTLRSTKFIFTAAVAAFSATPALAELPAPVRDMIEAAIATEDADTVKAVTDIARYTNPDDVAEIDSLVAEFDRLKAASQAAAAAEEEAQIREAGLFDNWSGQGELGAFRSSGNSSNTGLTAGIKLKRQGIDWEHELRARADYQRSNGMTTREQFLAAYQPRYNLSERVFVYGLSQYERDRFQGYSARYSGSVGAGYRIIRQDDMSLTVEAGPAYRRTEFIDGTSDSNIAGFASLDYDWQIAETIRLTQEASAYLDSGNMTYISLSGLEAGLGDGLRARLSYAVEHDTDPPLGAVKTDTLSRFTLIYGF